MTLALYGKSRRRQGGLLSLGVLAVLVAMLAGVATYTAAFAHSLNKTQDNPTCESPGWSVVVKTDNWTQYREVEFTGDAGSVPYSPYILKGNNVTLVSIGDLSNTGSVTSSGSVAMYNGSWYNAPDFNPPGLFNTFDQAEIEDIPDSSSTVIERETLNGDSWASLGFGVGKVVRVDDELMKITSMGPGDYKFSVQRGFAGTTAVAHTGNEEVELWNRADSASDTESWDINFDATSCLPPPPETCSDFGLSMVDKLQWNGSAYVLDDTGSFPGQQVTITNGTATGGDWSSTQAIGLVIVKGGSGPNSVKTYPSPAPPFFPAGTMSGSFDNTGLLNAGGQVPAVSHVEFCEGTAVLNTGKILVKKIGPTIPGGLASTINFGGTVTGPDNGTWTAKVGETDASNDGIADGQYTVAETSGTGSVTGGKIEFDGYEELAGDATCPTPDANNYNDDGVVDVAEDTHTVCVLNKFIAIVDPTISKEKVQGGLTATEVFWDIFVDNTASGIDQTVEIHDSGVTWNSTSGASTGTCADTDFSDGKIVCTVKAGQTLKVQVKKDRPAAQCTDQTINNSATLYLVVPGAAPQQIGSDGGDASTQYTIPGDPDACDKPGITKEANSQTSEDSQTTQDPSAVWWTVTVTNPASGTGTAQTVWIKDSNVAVVSGPTFGGSATCAPNNAMADFETQLNDSDGVQCSMPNNSTITFTVKPAGTIARTCEDQKFNNTVYLYTGATTNTPLTASGEEFTLWGNEDLCPKPKVTFVKVMCGPDATLPGDAKLLFTSPNPVTYDPNALPADCFPMAGWNFYTGTTWNGSSLGGSLTTHTTGADGTVTHEMTTAEFNGAKTASGSPLTSYLVREEVRSPFTFGALQCYMDFGGAKGDNIEQVSFKDNPVADATCIAYNFVPRVTVNFVKAICPSLIDVPSNQGANADRGGLLGGADPAAGVKIDLTNIPEACDTVPGWTFNTGTEWNGSLGGSTDSHTTTATGGPGGIAGVQHTLTGAEFMAALKDFQTTGKSYFVQEVEQSPDYLFGAIKCYADHYLDDKIERVDFEEWGLPTGDVYCIAYNVKAERQITIDKHFITDGYVAGAGDTPTFTLYDEDYPAVTFASACLPAANGVNNHLAWICTVPYDWDGTVTETPADGWEEVKCEARESFLSQVSGLVQEIIDFELKSEWEFCNAPYAEVKVQKTFVGDFAAYPAFTFTEDLPGAVSSAGPAANTTVSVYDQQVALGTYNVSEVEALTEDRGCFGDNAAGYFTHVSVTKNGSTIFAKQEASGASIPVTAPGDQVTVTIYNTRCELAASPILIVEKFADPAGNRSGTNSISGFQIAVFVDAVQLDGDLVAPGVQPFTSNGGPIVIPGLDPATITAVEVNPNTGGWMFTGSKTDVGDDGSFEKSVAGQPAAEAITYDDVLRFNFYNQPRVNIEVNKTEISLATPAGAPGNGWSFTLTGCGITPQVKATDATGKATFSDLPPAVACSYTVTETVKAGWSAINPVQVTAPATAGQTAVLSFTNVKIEVCTENCFRTFETPTPTPETPTVTPTPETPTPETPTATPTEEPTKEPTEDVVSGEKTPGPGQTPIAPSTGTGLLGSGPAGMNMLFALVGLLAISLGTTILALGRKSSRR